MLLNRSILLKEGESTEMLTQGREKETLVKYSQNEQQLLKKKKDNIYFDVISTFKLQMFPPYGLIKLYTILEHLMAIKCRSDPKVWFQYTLHGWNYLVLTIFCCGYKHEA